MNRPGTRPPRPQRLRSRYLDGTRLRLRGTTPHVDPSHLRRSPHSPLSRSPHATASPDRRRAISRRGRSSTVLRQLREPNRLAGPHLRGRPAALRGAHGRPTAVRVFARQPQPADAGAGDRRRPRARVGQSAHERRSVGRQPHVGLGQRRVAEPGPRGGDAASRGRAVGRRVRGRQGVRDGGGERSRRGVRRDDARLARLGRRVRKGPAQPRGQRSGHEGLRRRATLGQRHHDGAGPGADAAAGIHAADAAAHFADRARERPRVGCADPLHAAGQRCRGDRRRDARREPQLPRGRHDQHRHRGAPDDGRPVGREHRGAQPRSLRARAEGPRDRQPHHQDHDGRHADRHADRPQPWHQLRAAAQQRGARHGSRRALWRRNRRGSRTHLCRGTGNGPHRRARRHGRGARAHRSRRHAWRLDRHAQQAWPARPRAVGLDAAPLRRQQAVVDDQRGRHEQQRTRRRGEARLLRPDADQHPRRPQVPLRREARRQRHDELRVVPHRR